MKRIIAIANQKGGVGKTTTAINLSACMAEQGKRVLCIDMDPQGNTTSGLGIDKANLDCSVYDVLLGEKEASDAIVRSGVEHLHVLPSTVDLTGAEIELLSFEDKEYLLKNQIGPLIRNNYDYILIDCPPSLSILTVNALSAADTVLVPIQCEFYALEGLSQLMYTVNLIKERLNPDLQVEGIVFTMYDSRTNLANDVVDSVERNLRLHIYNTKIPRNVRLAEAPSYGMPINLYDSHSAGAKSYKKLAKEVIKRKGLRKKDRQS